MPRSKLPKYVITVEYNANSYDPLLAYMVTLKFKNKSGFTSEINRFAHNPYTALDNLCYAMRLYNVFGIADNDSPTLPTEF